MKTLQIPDLSEGLGEPLRCRSPAPGHGWTSYEEDIRDGAKAKLKEERPARVLNSLHLFGNTQLEALEGRKDKGTHFSFGSTGE